MARLTKAEKAELAEKERLAAEQQQADAAALEEELERPPTADELAERRAARASAEADRKLEEEMGGHGDGEGGNGGSSISERAENGGEQIGEEADGQLFVWEQGRKVSLGNLIPRGVDIENVFVFTGKRVKGKGANLMALDESGLLLVRFLSGGPRPVPTHDENEKVTKVTVEQHVITKTVTAIESQPLEAIAALRPVLDRLGYDIVERQSQATG
jgi:hypothetical protein